MIALTARQADALRFIAAYIEAKGYSPSLTDLNEGLAIRGKGAVHRLVACLTERGAIKRLPSRARAIEVVCPIAIPRDPDGRPLYYVRIGGGQ